MKTKHSITVSAVSIVSNVIELFAQTFGSGVAFEHIRFFVNVAEGCNETTDLRNSMGYSRASISRAVARFTEWGLMTAEVLPSNQGTKLILTTKAQQFFVEN